MWRRRLMRRRSVLFTGLPRLKRISVAGRQPDQNTSLKQQATRGANVLPDGSFESYAVGDVLSNARAVITSEAAHSGTKACVLRAVRSTTRTRRIITIPISFQACRFAITRSITWRRGLSCRLARPPIRPFIWCSDFPSILPMAGRGFGLNVKSPSCRWTTGQSQWLSDQQPNRAETGNGEDLHPEHTKSSPG